MKRNDRSTMGLPGRMRNAFGAGLGGAVALAIALSSTTTASAEPHSPFPGGVTVFGDSLSDTGNFFGATGQPPFPYWEGRVSDGPVWIEHLAAKLRIPADPADNYAWLGSTTGDTNFRDMPEFGIFFPGFEQQIGAFLANAGDDGADPEALYAIWIGANDFFDWLVKQDKTPDQLIMGGVSNTVQGIMALADAGARHFVVGNIPDLGATPDGRALGPAISGLLSNLSAAYNAVLEEQLVALEAGLGIFITRLDAYDVIAQLSTRPEDFGLTNVTDPAIASFPAVDSSQYLFWDGVHPTTAAHEWTADFVCAAMVETYAPPKARGNGPTTPRALNGLVKAAVNRN